MSAPAAPLPATDANEAVQRVSRAALILRQTIRRNVPDGRLRITALDFVDAALAMAVRGVRNGG